MIIKMIGLQNKVYILLGKILLFHWTREALQHHHRQAMLLDADFHTDGDLWPLPNMMTLPDQHW